MDSKRNIMLSIYLGREAKEKGFCLKNIEIVKSFIECIKDRMNYDCFYILTRYLTQFIKKSEEQCLYHPGCTLTFDIKSKIDYGWETNKLVYFKKNKVGWITEMRNVSTRFGISRVIFFVSQEGRGYKSWIPHSCYKSIQHCVEGVYKISHNVTYFDGRRVYFIVVGENVYKGNRYPLIKCFLI